MDELESCPWCKKEVSIISVEDSTYYWCITCEDCDFSWYVLGTRKEVIEKWNRRPAKDAKVREIERLKTALEQIASIRNLNPEMKASKFSSCAEDNLRNLYCTMGDIAIQTLGKDTNVPTKESEDSHE